MPARNLPARVAIKAALITAAANALIDGDASALERMLRTHEQMFRNERPPAMWSVGLAQNESPGDARTIIAREHFFETWTEFAAFKGQMVDGPARLSIEEVDALFRRLAMPALKAMG
jgi:hypothetical protein